MPWFKPTIASVFLLIASINILGAQTHFYPIPTLYFEKAQEFENDMYSPYAMAKKAKQYIHTEEFKISHFITLKEYKEFLEQVKETLTETPYKNLLPDSAIFTEGSYKEYLNSGIFDEYPVVGVTWLSAIEFCKWKTIKENGDSIEFVYRLPLIEEWLAAHHFLNKQKSGHDFGIHFSDWLFDEYDESNSYYSHDLNPIDTEQHFDKKRRKIIGESYIMQNEKMNIKGHFKEPNEAASYIAFRCVKEEVCKFKKTSDTLTFGFVSEKMVFPTSYKLLKYWNLYNNVATYKEISEKEKTEQNINSKDFYKTEIVKYKYYGKKKETPSQRLIKYFGFLENGEKTGDWYFFNRKGELIKHMVFSGESKRTIENNYPHNKTIHKANIGFHEFADSLINSHKGKKENIHSKNLAYQLNKGKMDGYFIISGKMFNVAGSYANNVKNGDWYMWNCNDELLVHRYYHNGVAFDRKFNRVPENKLLKIINSKPYRERDSLFQYPYRKIDESDVIWSKTVWRELLPEDNPLLFENQFLLKTIISAIKKKEIVAYNNKGNFIYGNSISPEEVLTYFDTTLNIIGYSIKEANMFDCSCKDLENRAIAISPLVENGKNRKRELFWLYIPQTRNAFSKIILEGTNLPEHIKTLDDLFYFRYYSGKLIAVSNVYNNRKLSDYCIGKNLELEQLREQEQIYKFEFDLWRYYSRSFEIEESKNKKQ